MLHGPLKSKSLLPSGLGNLHGGKCYPAAPGIIRATEASSVAMSLSSSNFSAISVAGVCLLACSAAAQAINSHEFRDALLAGIDSLAALIYRLITGARNSRSCGPARSSDGKIAAHPVHSLLGGHMLKEGSRAPAFSLQDDHGRQASLSDYAGKKQVVLFFYPKADTPG
jgi:hypothetical protein